MRQVRGEEEGRKGGCRSPAASSPSLAFLPPSAACPVHASVSSPFRPSFPPSFGCLALDDMSVSLLAAWQDVDLDCDEKEVSEVHERHLIAVGWRSVD